MLQGILSPKKISKTWRKLSTFEDGKTDVTLEISDSPRQCSWDTFASCDATASEIFGNASVHTISAMFITLYSSLGSHF